MKLLLCHDGPMPIDRHGNAYPQSFTEEVLSRYYYLSNNITFFVRTKLIDENKIKVPKVNMEKLSIVSSPNLADIRNAIRNRKNAKEILINEIKKNDLIIVRLPSQIGNLAIDLAKKIGKPYLIELVGSPWDSLWFHSKRGKLVAPLMHFTTGKRVKKSKYTVYVTNEYLQKKYPTVGKSVNCSNVSIKEFDQQILKRRIIKINMKKREEKIIIGTIGAVNIKYKGQEDVIRALSELKKEGFVNFEYHLVGGGDSTYLKNISKKYDVMNQVKFIGTIPHQNISQWLDTIDIYAQPSKTEGLPRALIEAMNRSLPALGSKVGGIPELLEPKYIYNINKKSVANICNILKGFTKETMIQQAERNFNESKKYGKDIIENRRKSFFDDFVKQN